MLTTKKFFQAAIVLTILILPSALALAQNNGSSGGLNGSSGGTNGSSGGLNGSSGNSITLQNPLGSNGPQTLCGLIKKIVDVVVAVGFPFAVFFIVYAGFLFVWARGNPVELAHARRNLMYTVIGLMIFFGAWLLTQVIANTLNSIGNPTIQICQ
jgi:hypothetical protein